jgi:hypothetical protein
MTIRARRTKHSSWPPRRNTFSRTSRYRSLHPNRALTNATVRSANRVILTGMHRAVLAGTSARSLRASVAMFVHDNAVGTSAASANALRAETVGVGALLVEKARIPKAGSSDLALT